MSENTIDILGNIIVPFVTIFVSVFITLKISEKKESEVNYQEEKRKINSAVKRFKQSIIGQYMDVLNDGRAYTELKNKVSKGNTEINFIDLRDCFIDEANYYNGEIINEYNVIRSFYESKVYGQYNNCDFVFAKDYIELIEKLGLDKDMDKLRKKFKEEKSS